MHARITLLTAAIVTAIVIVTAGGYTLLHTRSAAAADSPSTSTAPAPVDSERAESESVQLTDSQLTSIAVGPVETHKFAIQKEAVGSIDFNEDLSVQVFSPYQGRILETFADVGDVVKKDKVLFTIESPDFIAAQSNLIAAAATLDQTTSALERAKKLYAAKGIDQNDYETAVASQYTAEGALRAARHAVAIFGKSEAEIERLVASRQVETALVVRSPISGEVTARNAAPGLLAQPGNPPAPYAIADVSAVWMLAQVVEADSPVFKVGQAVTARVPAYPDRVFTGTISRLGATVDPNSRRVTLRSQIDDPEHLLRPGMFAAFIVTTADPVSSPAVPLNGVVREGDGTMSVWVVGQDRHHFIRRTVTIGLQQDGFDQILDGLRAGEPIATTGAILLSNILYGGAS
jgi:membrane fusion protein, heavy metal efflux system